MVVRIIFIIWAVAVYLVSFIGFLTLPHSEKFGNDFLKSFSNWDGGHFIGIAQVGYSEKFQYAFFPFYPLTIRALNQIIDNFLLSAILISIGSTFLALHLLYKLVARDFDKKVAQKVVWSLLFFPTSFFFLTTYSEGLFFLLVIATFYFLRQHRILLATIFTALASATRLAGLALVLALLLEVQTTVGINRKNWYVLFAPLGFLIYSWYLYSQTSDPFYFITAENYWLRNLAPIGMGFWETIKNIATPGFLDKNFNAVIDLLFAIFGVGMTIRSFRFLPLSYSIYSLAAISLPLLTPSLSSMPRFLLPIFPIFILLALIKNNYLNLTYQIISLMLLSVFTILFLNGFWVS